MTSERMSDLTKLEISEGDTVRLKFTKRNKMGWLHRLYGPDLVVDTIVGSLVYLRGIPQQHNGWLRDRFEKV